MHRLEQEAGIDLEAMQLDDVAEVAAAISRHVSSYPREPRPPLDPTLTKASLRQHKALDEAVAPWTHPWPPADRQSAAALLDVLWSVASYERLAVDWQMDDEQAIQTLTWAIAVIVEAVRNGRPPRRPRPE